MNTRLSQVILVLNVRFRSDWFQWDWQMPQRDIMTTEGITTGIRFSVPDWIFIIIPLDKAKQEFSLVHLWNTDSSIIGLICIIQTLPIIHILKRKEQPIMLF